MYTHTHILSTKQCKEHCGLNSFPNMTEKMGTKNLTHYSHNCHWVTSYIY